MKARQPKSFLRIIVKLKKRNLDFYYNLMLVHNYFYYN